MYILCQDSLDERKQMTDYAQKLLEGTLRIDLAEHNFEENQNVRTILHFHITL